MATVDGKKTGGRKKGVINKRNARLPDVQAIAERLGVNPFELLLRFAANDWESLGYDSRTKQMLSKGGDIIEVDNIEPSERIHAAKCACEYLFPKRKSVELTGADGKDFMESLTAVFKTISDEK